MRSVHWKELTQPSGVGSFPEYHALEYRNPLSIFSRDMDGVAGQFGISGKFLCLSIQVPGPCCSQERDMSINCRGRDSVRIGSQCKGRICKRENCPPVDCAMTIQMLFSDLHFYPCSSRGYVNQLDARLPGIGILFKETDGIIHALCFDLTQEKRLDGNDVLLCLISPSHLNIIPCWQLMSIWRSKAS